MRRVGTITLVLCGLALGCAREDRWTLSGQAPSALDERPGDAATRRPSVVPLQSIPLVERNGAVYVQNPNPKHNLLVTLLVSPKTGSANSVAPKRMQVLVPAGGEMRAGLKSDSSGTAWQYTKLDAFYQ